MERLQTKRLVTQAEIGHLSEEIQAAVSIEDFRPHHEERLAEITDELDVLARELKEQDALIVVHFRQAIHYNIELSGVEKFLYLRTVLTGKAAAAVSGIQATESNYAYAVELLKERFGKKHVLVQEHLTRLLNLPKVKALSDVGALRRLHDHVPCNIASLRTLGIDSDSYGAKLCAALFCVLPADLAVEFYKSQSTSNETPESSNLEAVLRSMRVELDSREKVYDGNTRDQPQPLKIHSDRDRSSDNLRGKGSAASLAVGAKPSNDGCPLCSSELHEAPQCNSAIPIEEKKRRLRSEGRCYRCAKRGHTSKECRNRFLRCDKCGRRHITPLCGTSPPSYQGATGTTELHSLASLNAINKNAVMLQTAQVWVDGRDRKRLARCLFDGGSQRSFVTEQLSRKLRLEVIGEEEVTIYSFGRTAGGTTRKRRLVRLWLRSQYSRKEHCLEALEIENICSDQLVLPDNVVDLAGVGELELADVTLSPFLNSKRSIEILVGADHYWNMVSGEVRKIHGSLVALKTDFGWTLQGPVPQVSSVLSCTTVAVLNTGVAKPTLSLSNELRAFWELESLGISVNDSPRGKEEQVREDFTSSLALVMGRYEAKLPWKPLNRPLENNEAVALQRLDKLVRRLKGNTERLTQYDSAIRSYLKEGFAEKVPAGVTRVLGLEWNRERDELKYSLESTLELLIINRDTKRFVLQASARIVDPFGLLSPVTITAKILFQELWALGLDWDTPLPPSVSLRWSNWIKALHHLEDISIPRRYASSGGRTELHVFTDASPQAYGTVAYLRSDCDNQTTVTLVMAKARVAPVKTLTLPRLELMGALLGARLCVYFKGVFKSDLSEVSLWTDSMIALHWVKGLATQWKPFVANRVMEIQQRTEPSNWRHCPGAENPADLLTRGVPPDCLQKCDLWCERTKEAGRVTHMLAYYAHW
ncbi:uncharacterized protein LOC120839888 [Ixodes scapularis]|uniref:uncharacterized protein LOC120839888 n=1 Tax=Ixodes scapularis TaxID=6945 RepID=UPI001A9DA4DF|nr:uncharacterized protein LOC120839888 [Ixodes scapularis]